MPDRRFRSTLFWLSILCVSVVEGIASLGAKTLGRLTTFLLRYEWVPSTITLIAKIATIPTVILDGLTLLLVGVICFVTVIAYSRGTSYSLRELRYPTVSNATIYLVVLFIVFALPRGGFQSVPKFLSETEILFLYRFLLSLALSGATIIPLMLGFYRSAEQDSLPPPRATGILSGSAYLFAGGLATLALMDGAIALVTIFVSVSRLSDWDGLPQIAPEENLVRSLSIIYRDSMGFAIFFSCITGLVVAAEVFLLGTSSPGLLSPQIWNEFPLLNIWSLGVVIICSLGAIAAIVRFLRIHRFDSNGLRLAFILVGSLWTIAAAVFLLGSVWGLIPPSIAPFAQYGYPIVLATGLVTVEAIRVTTDSLFWYASAVIGFCIFIVALYLHLSRVSPTLFLEFALVGYWGSPLLEWYGRSR